MKPYNIKKKPLRTFDLDRKPIVLVPLGGKWSTGLSAKLLEEDYNAILERGYSPNWFLNDDGKGRQYVRLAHRKIGNLMSVARLVIDPTSRQVIHYRDSDRLNLRRDNLFLADRASHIRKVLDDQQAT